MAWIKVGKAEADAEFTVTGPGTVVAEVALDSNGQDVMRQARAGRRALVVEGDTAVDCTVTGSDPASFTVTVETRRPR